jgi:hypothetical protein
LDTYRIFGYVPQSFAARKAVRVLRLLPDADGKKPEKKPGKKQE